MKNNKLIKTILVLAAIIVVCTLAGPAFAETGKKTAEEASEVTANKEEPAEAADNESSAVSETADPKDTAEESEENMADAETEEAEKHHKGRRPGALKSDPEKEAGPADGMDRSQNRRSGHKNEEGIAEEDQTGSCKKHPFGKDFDDDDDDEKRDGSKAGFGRGKRDSSEQRPERPEGPSGKEHKHGRDTDQEPSSKKTTPPACGKMKVTEKSTADAQNEGETGADATEETSAAETVTEEIPETETETPEGETVKDEA
ncbi:MAG: hypothetical protein IJI07_00245 [Flexilinea sp.]|nr:hypothetical protein [Flexilinea sp.]